MSSHAPQPTQSSTSIFGTSMVILTMLLTPHAYNYRSSVAGKPFHPQHRNVDQINDQICGDICTIHKVKNRFCAIVFDTHTHRIRVRLRTLN
jgi:hypothetical protein